jgi:hypothetical protein
MNRGALKRDALTLIFIAFTVCCGIARAALPTNVQFKTFYDTDSIHFNGPVWFGMYPKIPGSYLVGELAGDLFLLEPSGDGFTKTLFGHIPAFLVSGNDGLLGLAFHPNFNNNGKYYVYYIPVLGQGVLEERRVKAGIAADSGYSRTILTSSFGNTVHNGGDIHFGPDGYLYLAFGDAGNPNVYNTRSQDLTVLPGKMIRIDVDRQDPGLEYAIPLDNPFADSTNPNLRKEIWAYGLRQPWRWNFDPLNGRLFLADVGGWVEEEIDTITKGGNYGWNRREGNTCFNKDEEYAPLSVCDTTGLIGPLASYTHDPITLQGTGSVTGGVVFRGNPASSAYGAFIFGDFITKTLYAMLPVSTGVVQMEAIGTSPIGMSSFGTDSAGNIYMVGYTNGIIYRLDHSELKSLSLLRSGRPQVKLRIPMRTGGGWRFEPGAFPGMDRIHIIDLKGKHHLTLMREQMMQEFRLPIGLYLVEASGTESKTSFPLILN